MRVRDIPGWIFILACVGGSVALAAATLSKPSPKAGESEPPLVAEPSTAFLGDTMPGGKVTSIFKIRNTRDRRINLTGTDSSCGCTVAELAKRELLPDESTEVVATMDVGVKTGRLVVNIDVRFYVSGSDELLNLPLTMVADVLPLFKSEPGNLVISYDSQIIKDKTVQYAFKVRDNTGLNLSVTQVSVDHPAFKPIGATAIIDEPGTTLVKVELNTKECLLNSVGGTLTLHTNNLQYERCMLPIVAHRVTPHVE